MKLPINRNHIPHNTPFRPHNGGLFEWINMCQLVILPKVPLDRECMQIGGCPAMVNWDYYQEEKFSK